jgi:hypothetical protein
MKPIVAIPSTTIDSNGTITVVGDGSDIASALNDFTHFSTAPIPDESGYTYYGNAEHVDQFFTNYTQSTQPTAGTRSLNTTVGNPNDGSSGTFSASGGDTFIYVDSIEKTSEGQVLAILEGQQTNQVIFSPDATSTDAPFSEWLEVGATGLVPTTPSNQSIDPFDFPLSALMLPQGSGNISSVMSPNLSFYNPPANKAVGQFFSSNIYSPNIEGNPPLPYYVGNGSVAPMYISASADEQSLSNLNTILPDATAGIFSPPFVNKIIVGYSKTQILVSTTVGFAVGQTVTVYFGLESTNQNPVPTGWNCGKIISIDSTNGVLYTNYDIFTPYVLGITGIDERNFVLPTPNVGFVGNVTTGSTHITNLSAYNGFVPGMLVNDSTHTSYVTENAITSVSGTYITLATGAGGTATGDQFVALGNANDTSLTWASGTTHLTGFLSGATVVAGQYVVGTGIPAGATVVSSSGSGSSVTVVISKTTTASGSSAELTSAVYDFTISGGYKSSFTFDALVSNTSVLMSPVSQVQGSLLAGMSVTGSYVSGTTTVANPNGVEDAYVSGQPVTFEGSFATGVNTINVASTTLPSGYTSNGMFGLSVGQILAPSNYFPDGTCIIGINTTDGYITVSNTPTQTVSLPAFENFTTEPMYAQTFSFVGEVTNGSTTVTLTETNTSYSSVFYGLTQGTVICTNQLYGANYTIAGINTGDGTITLSEVWAGTTETIQLNGYNGYVYLSQPATGSGKVKLTVGYTVSTATAFGATIEGHTTLLNTDGGVGYKCEFFSAPYVATSPYNNPNYGGLLILPVKINSISNTPLTNATSVATIGNNNSFVSGTEKYANVFQSSTFVGTFIASGGTYAENTATVSSVKGDIRVGSQLFIKGGSGGNLVFFGTQGGVLTITAVSGTTITFTPDFFQSGVDGGTTVTAQIIATPPVQIADLTGVSIGQAYASGFTTLSVSGSHYSPAVSSVLLSSNATLDPVVDTKTFTGNTSFNSAVINNIPNTQGLLVGMAVSGTYVPAGTVIESVDTANQITLSANATSTSTLSSFTANYYNIYIGEYVGGTTNVFNGYHVTHADSYNTRIVVGEAVVSGSYYGTSSTYTMEVEGTENLSVATPNVWTGNIATTNNGICQVSESAIANINIGDVVYIPYSVGGLNPEGWAGYSNAFVSSIVSGGISNGENVYTVFLEDNDGQPYPIKYAPLDGTGEGDQSGTFVNYTPQYIYNKSRLVCLGINATKNTALMWAVDKPLPVGGKFVNTSAYPNGNNQNSIYPVTNTVPIASAFTTPLQDGSGAGVIALRGNITGNHDAGTAVSSYDKGNRYFGSSTVGDLETLSPINIGSLFGTTLSKSVNPGATSATVAPLKNTSNLVGGTYYDQYGNVATQGFPITSGTSLKGCTVYEGNNYITAVWNTNPTNGGRPSVGWNVTGAGIPANTFVTYVRGTEIGISNNATASAVEDGTFTFTPDVWGVMVVGQGDTQESVIFTTNYAFTSGQETGNTVSPATFQLAKGQAFSYPHAVGEPVFVPNIKTTGFANQHAKEAPILGGADNSAGNQGINSVVVDNTNGQVATTATFTLGLSPILVPVGAKNTPNTSATVINSSSSGDTSITLTNISGFPDNFDTPYNTTNFVTPEVGRLAGYTASGTNTISLVLSETSLPKDLFSVRIGTDYYYVYGGNPSSSVSSTNAVDVLLFSNTANNYYDGTPVHVGALSPSSRYNSVYVPNFRLNRSFTGVLTEGSASVTGVVSSTELMGSVYSSSGGTAGQNTLSFDYSPPQIGMRIFGDASIQKDTYIVSFDSTTSTAVLSKPFLNDSAYGSLWAAFEVQGEGVPLGSFIQNVSGSTVTLGYFTNAYGTNSAIGPASATVSGTQTINIYAGLPTAIGQTPNTGFTTVYTTPLAVALSAGDTIHLSSGGHSDQVTLASSANVGDTSITIEPYVPTFSHECSVVSNGALFGWNNGNVNGGTVASYGLPNQILAGDPIVLVASNSLEPELPISQSLVVAETPSFDATSIVVEPFSPNYAYDDNPTGIAFTGSVTSGSNVVATTNGGSIHVGQQIFDGSGNDVFSGASAFVQSVSTTTVVSGGGTTYYGGLENMVVGGDGNLYGFSNTGNVGIFKISPTGVVENFFPASTYFSGVFQSACAGSDGAIWYYNDDGTLLVRMSYSGTFTTYSTPFPTYQNGSLCLGPDGNLWTSGWAGAGETSPTVYKVSTSGTFTAVPLIGDSITSVNNNIISDGTYLYVADNNGTQRLLRWDTGGNAFAHGVISGMTLLGNIAYDGTLIWMLGTTGGLAVASVNSSGTVTYYNDTTLTTGVSNGVMEWFYGFLVFNISENIYIANIASFTSGSFTSEGLAPVSGGLNFYCDNTNTIFWSWTGNSPTCELVGIPISGSEIMISPLLYNGVSITEWLLNLSTNSVSDQSSISFYTNGTSITTPPVYNMNDGNNTEELVPAVPPVLLPTGDPWRLSLARPMLYPHSNNTTVTYYRKPITHVGDTVITPDTKKLKTYNGKKWIDSEISSVQVHHAAQSSTNGNDKISLELLDTQTGDVVPLDTLSQFANNLNVPTHTVRMGGKRSTHPSGRKWKPSDLHTTAIRVSTTTPAGKKTLHRSTRGVFVIRPKGQLDSVYMAPSSNVLFERINGNYQTVSQSGDPAQNGYTINWVYNDGIKTVPPVGYEIKIYDAAVASSKFFSPDSTNPLVHTVGRGPYTSSAITWSDGYVNGATYVAFVRVLKQKEAQTEYTDWVATSFATTVEQPLPPLVAVSPDASISANKLSIQTSDNLFSAQNGSFDNGASGWHTTANDTDSILDSGGTGITLGQDLVAGSTYTQISIGAVGSISDVGALSGTGTGVFSVTGNTIRNTAENTAGAFYITGTVTAGSNTVTGVTLPNDTNIPLNWLVVSKNFPPLTSLLSVAYSSQTASNVTWNFKFSQAATASGTQVVMNEALATEAIGFPLPGKQYWVLVGSEKILVETVPKSTGQGSELQIIQRGYLGTTPASHSLNATVTYGLQNDIYAGYEGNVYFNYPATQAQEQVKDLVLVADVPATLPTTTQGPAVTTSITGQSIFIPNGDGLPTADNIVYVISTSGGIQPGDEVTFSTTVPPAPGSPPNPTLVFPPKPKSSFTVQAVQTALLKATIGATGNSNGVADQIANWLLGITTGGSITDQYNSGYIASTASSLGYSSNGTGAGALGKTIQLLTTPTGTSFNANDIQSFKQKFGTKKNPKLSAGDQIIIEVDTWDASKFIPDLRPPTGGEYTQLIFGENKNYPEWVYTFMSAYGIRNPSQESLQAFLRWSTAEGNEVAYNNPINISPSSSWWEGGTAPSPGTYKTITIPGVGGWSGPASLQPAGKFLRFHSPDGGAEATAAWLQAGASEFGYNYIFQALNDPTISVVPGLPYPSGEKAPYAVIASAVCWHPGSWGTDVGICQVTGISGDTVTFTGVNGYTGSSAGGSVVTDYNTYVSYDIGTATSNTFVLSGVAGISVGDYLLVGTDAKEIINNPDGVSTPNGGSNAFTPATGETPWIRNNVQVAFTLSQTFDPFAAIYAKGSASANGYNPLNLNVSNGLASFGDFAFSFKDPATNKVVACAYIPPNAKVYYVITEAVPVEGNGQVLELTLSAGQSTVLPAGLLLHKYDSANFYNTRAGATHTSLGTKDISAHKVNGNQLVPTQYSFSEPFRIGFNAPPIYADAIMGWYDTGTSTFTQISSSGTYPSGANNYAFNAFSVSTSVTGVSAGSVIQAQGLPVGTVVTNLYSPGGGLEVIYFGGNVGYVPAVTSTTYATEQTITVYASNSFVIPAGSTSVPVIPFRSRRSFDRHIPVLFSVPSPFGANALQITASGTFGEITTYSANGFNNQNAIPVNVGQTYGFAGFGTSLYVPKRDSITVTPSAVSGNTITISDTTGITVGSTVQNVLYGINTTVDNVLNSTQLTLVPTQEFAIASALGVITELPFTITVEPTFKLLVDWYDNAGNFLVTDDGTTSLATGEQNYFNTLGTMPSSDFTSIAWQPSAIVFKAPPLTVFTGAKYTPTDPANPQNGGTFNSSSNGVLTLAQGTNITVEGVANGVISKPVDADTSVTVKFPNRNGPKTAGGSYTLNIQATYACPRIQFSNTQSGDVYAVSGLIFQAMTPHLPDNTYVPLNTLLPALTQTPNPLNAPVNTFAIPQTTPTSGVNTLYLFDPTNDNSTRELHRGTSPTSASYAIASNALAGDETISLNNVNGLARGAEITIGSGQTNETNYVSSAWDGTETVALNDPLVYNHNVGEIVSATVTLITNGLKHTQKAGTLVGVFNYNNDGYINTPNTTYSYNVQRSDDGGITYTTLYGANAVSADETGVALQTDVQVIPNAVNYYQVIPTFVDINGTSVPGVSVSGLPSPKLQTNSWWLGSTSNPALRFPVLVQNQVEETQKHPVGVFYPLGSSRPVITQGVVQGRDATITIIWTDIEHWQDFINMLNLGETLVLTDPVEGERRYIALSDDVKVTHNSGGSPYREVSITYVEAPPPSGYSYTYGQ